MKKSRKIIIGLLALIFIVLIILIKTNLIEKFDDYFYELFTFSINDSLTCFHKFITFFGSTAFIIALSVFLLILFIALKMKNKGFVVAGVIIISTVVNNVVKLIVRRGRPDVIKLVEEHTFSFPSGHTMAAVSLYGILLFIILKSNMNKKLKTTFSIILGVLPVLIAISRVYLGAHFMSDVVGAYVMSTLLLLVETYYIDKKNWL